MYLNPDVVGAAAAVAIGAICSYRNVFVTGYALLCCVCVVVVVVVVVVAVVVVVERCCRCP